MVNEFNVTVFVITVSIQLHHHPDRRVALYRTAAVYSPGSVNTIRLSLNTIGSVCEQCWPMFRKQFEVPLISRALAPPYLWDPVIKIPVVTIFCASF